MSDVQQLSLGIDKPHRNQYLFSDHYLEEILRREAAWKAAQGPAAEFLAFLRGRYAAEADQLEAYNEAQLEENWLKPILAQLGHVWEPQASVPGMDRQIKKPDYVFFPDDAARKAAVSEQRTEEYARQAPAVGEVKAWPVNLSRKSAGAPVFDNNNPMFQIDYYLKATGVTWGIVSNGRFWRLVHRDSSYRLDRYFEIDLLDALTTPDERRALAVATYFTLFFGRDAFVRDEQGRVFLDDVLAGSHTYAVALESDLRDNAYKALEQAILGFFAPAGNGLDPHDEDDRAAVYRHSLLLLYRLLFLFYGESRGLLPMGNDEYRTRSLSALADNMARDVENDRAHPPMTRHYWGRLRELFRIINGGDAALNAWLGVPRYNGGLFDPARHPFLENHFVGDAFLVRAVDYLARRRVTKNGQYGGRERVDYRTLGVRQLGSIYEGLLEYKVSVAVEAMVTVRQGGKETWRSARERGKAKAIETKGPGELYLATDKGERKATGSYYTPDYIVKYIVEQTLGPLVEEARRKVTSDERRSVRPRTPTSEETAAGRFERAILSLNVLDPAMGSGHFLVEATNFLARALATADLATSDELRATGEDESDLTYWKRRVVEACIYGVDKNELAVELAKLSLWLETVAADKPLSFLDHHLRHGDSLIGAGLGDLARAPGAGRGRKGAGETGAEPLFDESAFTTSAGLAVGGAAAIEEMLTDDLDAVHAKERIWAEIHETHLGRWRQLADLWISAYFGNAMSAAEYADLARRTQGKPGGLMSDEQAARWLEHPAAVNNDYFHWELEFPEVFFDEYGRPKGETAGFDAVISNPPYIDIKGLDKVLVKYLFLVYPTLMLRINVFAAFIERAITILRSNSRKFGFIIPTAFLTQVSYSELRKLLLKEYNIESVVRLPNELFGDAVGDVKVDTCILIVKKESPDRNTKTQVMIYDTFTRISEIDPLTAKLAYVTLQKEWQTGSEFTIALSNPSGNDLVTKIATAGNPLEEYCEFCLGITPYDKYRGHTKEQIENKVFHAQRKVDGTYRRLLVSGDVTRFAVTWNGKEWIKYGDWLAAPREQRFFTQERILIQQIIDWSSRRLLAGWTDEELYNTQNQFNLLARTNDVNLKYILAILNSKLITYYHRAKFLDVALQRFQKILIKDAKTFPIPDGRELNIDVTVLNATINDLSSESSVSNVHDLLAYLAEQMIAMHREKQSLTADFWTDLEGVCDPAVFRKLRDKGKQEAGLAAELETEFLPRNSVSKRTRTLDESLAWDEAAFKGFVRALAGRVDHLSGLVKVYHTHAPRYRELTERIGRTDWLIDQIVYQLYGLTDEEIAIVEGRAA